MTAVAPGHGQYVDLQVNGYAGVDFNSDALTGDALDEACRRLRADGVRQILATIITDDLDAMGRRLGEVGQASRAGCARGGDDRRVSRRRAVHQR